MELRYKPTEMKFHVTKRCNGTCYFCYTDSGLGNNWDSRGELTIDEMKNVVKSFSGFHYPSLGAANIDFSGGEPMIRFEEIVQLMKYCNKINDSGLHLIITTNGGLIGAEGTYRKKNEVFLKEGGLYNRTPREAVRILKENGLEKVQISVDAAHTTLSDEPGKVPLESLNNCFRAFLEAGYNQPRKIELIVTTGRDDNANTQEIMGNLAQANGLTLNNMGNYANDEAEIKVRRQKVQNIGRLYCKKNYKERLPLDKLFSFQCRRRSKAESSEKWMRSYWSDCVAVDADGTVYACQNMTIPIGNVREADLKEIKRRLESREKHPIYGPGIEIVNIYQDFSTISTSNNHCVGECLKLINESEPDMLNKINSDVEACYALGRDTGMQRVLFEQYDRRKSEIMGRIAAIDDSHEKRKRRREKMYIKRLLKRWSLKDGIDYTSLLQSEIFIT